MNIQQVRNQHEELLRMVNEISKYLEVGKLSTDAQEVKTLFIKLLGLLKVHLSLEDEWLYPKLEEHSDVQIRDMAKRFSDEMGGIGKAVADYKQKWIITPLAIQDNPDGFIGETNELFKALGQRIEKENRELYKSVEEF